jgi:hypothetical protein
MPFQDFFSSIMEKCHPGDFTRICPWGSEGDLKNDGYLRSKRMLFSVYAPERMEESVAIKKIEKDFYGALPHWQGYFDSWIFVHNSKKGLPPGILKKLVELEKEQNVKGNPLKLINWGCSELMTNVFSLSDNDVSSLLGLAPTRYSITSIGFAEIGVVVKGIEGRAPAEIEHIFKPPAEKIRLNRLSKYAESLLHAGMMKSKDVGDFLNKYHDPTLGDRLAAAFKAEYELLKAKGLEPDRIYSELWQFAGGRIRGTNEEESAVLAVLSYLFEKCDIFEGNQEDEK